MTSRFALPRQLVGLLGDMLLMMHDSDALGVFTHLREPERVNAKYLHGKLSAKPHGFTAECLSNTAENIAPLNVLSSYRLMGATCRDSVNPDDLVKRIINSFVKRYGRFQRLGR